MHEIHANEGVNLKIIDESDGVGDMSAGYFDWERISPGRTEGKSVCPTETWLRGNLSRMGKSPENFGFERIVY